MPSRRLTRMVKAGMGKSWLSTPRYVKISRLLAPFSPHYHGAGGRTYNPEPVCCQKYLQAFPPHRRFSAFLAVSLAPHSSFPFGLSVIFILTSLFIIATLVFRIVYTANYAMSKSLLRILHGLCPKVVADPSIVSNILLHRGFSLQCLI